MADPSSHTVLVVEDEEVVRRIVSEILEVGGYEVLTAVNGPDALAQVLEHEGDIELMLTDIVMPGMSGRELAERIARSRPETKVIFMSGYTAEIKGHEDSLALESRFIQKPFSMDSLTALVRDVLAD